MDEEVTMYFNKSGHEYIRCVNDKGNKVIINQRYVIEQIGVRDL